MKGPHQIVLSALVAVVFVGCSAQLGPRAVPQAQLDYNRALVRSWDEQLLLNLVRLRYRDNPVFLQISSVLTKYSFDLGAGISGSFDFDGNSDAGASGSVGYGENPTITYRPLQGDEFVESLLTPIRPTTLVLLSQSGWSIERLLLCCVQRIDEVENAIAAAGPTPDYVPEYESFHRLAGLLRELQKRGMVRVSPTEEGEVRIRIQEDERTDEIRQLLGLGPETLDLRAVPEGSGASGPGDLVVGGRSLLAVMFFLSQAVEPPPAHREAGLVTRTLDPEGRPFDWSRVTGEVLRVRSGSRRPDRAAVAVRYRGHWFYIDDGDLNSKTTFSLLNYLFILKSGAKAGEEPLLTLGVG